VIKFYGIDASERHFLQKPFEGQKLLERVQDLVDAGEPSIWPHASGETHRTRSDLRPRYLTQ
jgi:hypothetical protein